MTLTLPADGDQHAIAFYQNIFTNNLTVNIKFHKMNSCFGQNTVFIYIITYNTYCKALAASATSADDATALANTPSGATNPINSIPNLDVKTPNSLAIGLNTPEMSFNFMNSPCATCTGSGCIGLNVALANSIGGALMAAVEHEIDEVLGLGSALNGTMIPSDSWPEASSAGPAGAEVAQVYLALPAAIGEPPKRLIRSAKRKA